MVLHGAFAPEHEAEIIGLMRNEEAAEKAEHPLNRIMAIAPGTDGIEIRTTDIHLPRRLGTALKHAYRGGYFVRVNWRRD